VDQGKKNKDSSSHSTNQTEMVELKTKIIVKLKSKIKLLEGIHREDNDRCEILKVKIELSELEIT
jgi:hypothetical protein